MSKTTFYVDGNEIVLNHNTNKTDIKRHIAGKVIVTLTDVNASGIAASTDTKYLLRDHLGSVISILDNSGSAQEMSFDPWGQRNSPTDWRIRLGNYPSNPAQFTVTTNRGFTGHEMVDTMGLIHMNGRIYDPRLQRFMQADPFVDGVTSTQGYNRYTYVGNNPLAYTDPSDYFKLREWVGAIVAIVGTYICAGNVACGEAGYALVGALSGASGAAANGGNVLQGAVIGGVSAAAFSGIGDAFAACVSCAGDFAGSGLNAFAFAGKVGAHAVTGGVMSVLQGGKFGHGFAAAGVTQGFAGKINGIQTEQRFSALRIAAAATVGGTASRITGGKFADGAITGTFSRLFNDERFGVKS